MLPLASPADIDITALEQNLRTARIGRPLRILAQIDSTNEEIKRNLAANLPEGAVVIADHQTHGRGRQGRSWYSEPATGLYLSTLLKPNLPPEDLACLTLMAGVATVSAIQQQTSALTKLKWPNDILLNGKKIAGILCECIAEPGSHPSIIIGIGINLNHTSFPESLQDIATSLKMETGQTVDRTQLALSLLQNLDSEFKDFGNRENLIRKWTEQSDMFGKTVTIHQKGKEQTGIALGLNPQGKLILQTPDGKQHLLDSGELLAAH